VDLKGRLGEIVLIANNLVVKDEVSFKKITALYSESKDWEKQIEFIRKQANQPDQERINARNDKAKELLTPLKQIQEIAKKKTAGYQEMLEEVKRQEEAKIKEAVDLLGLEDMPYLPPMIQTQRSASAVAYTKQVKRFKVEDLSKVPLQFLQLNEEAVEQAIKLGQTEIPGVLIWEEKVTQLRTR